MDQHGGVGQAMCNGPMDFSLQGRHVRLEPLDRRHIEGLAVASAADPTLYQWSPVPQGKVETTSYVETALAWRDAGTASQAAPALPPVKPELARSSVAKARMSPATAPG